jgi:hypothetical protein
MFTSGYAEAVHGAQFKDPLSSRIEVQNCYAKHSRIGFVYLHLIVMSTSKFYEIIIDILSVLLYSLVSIYTYNRYIEVSIKLITSEITHINIERA